MQLLDTVFIIVVVIFSAIIHEVMHGVAADRLGDPTARYAGRLTLNPFKHLDPFGSVILPIMLVTLQSPIFFAWAKPVPYNPYNLRPSRWSEAIVAGAGPLSNFVIALLGGLVIRLNVFSADFNSVIFLIVIINTMLCFFNLIPVPPLDGSKVLSALLPQNMAISYNRFRAELERNPFAGMLVVVLIVYFLGSAYSNFLYSIANAIAGM